MPSRERQGTSASGVDAHQPKTQKNSVYQHRTPILASKRHESIFFGLFILGAIAGLVQLSAPIPFGTGFEMVALGRNLATHGTFANPFWALNTGPTAANPPLYPFFLAILIKLLRVESLIVMAATVSNIAANALVAAWLPKVSLIFYRDIRPGVLASIFWIISAQLMPSWDASFTTVTILVFCVFCASNLGSTSSIRRPIAAGGIAGALFLFNPSTVLISVPWVGFLFWQRKIPWKHTLLLFTVLGAIILSWAARNYVELGKFVTRTNLGMTLYSSNNDCASPSMIADQANNCFQSHHPNMSVSEARLLLSIGEIEFDKLRTADAENWIKTHPEAFKRLTLDRFREFWLPPLQASPLRMWTVRIITILSLPGLISMVYKRVWITSFMIVTLFLYPLMYYVVVSDVRYRYPLLWLSELPAGFFLCICFDNLAFKLRRARLVKSAANH